MKAVSFDFGEKYKKEFEKLKKEEIELRYLPFHLNKDTIDKIKEEEVVVITTASKINKELAEGLKEKGVRVLLTTSAGYEHIDVKAVKEQGILVGNIPSYSPSAISEYVLMTLLMSLRKMKTQMKNIQNKRFLLEGVRGRELGELAAGVIGGGRIGFETCKLLKAFTKKVYIHDPYPRKEMKTVAEYAGLEEIYKNCDIIILHCSLNEGNYHMIDKDSILRLKSGVLLINPSRGGLVDYKAVLEGLQDGKISGLVFDVYEGEENIIGKSFQEGELKDPIFLDLIEREDVIYTNHTAFYTDKAIRNMVKSILTDIVLFTKEGRIENPL